MKLITAVQDNLKGTIRTIHQKVREYIGEELWGDLWEQHHRLLKNQTPVIIAQSLTIYRYIQMLSAKFQISLENRRENSYCAQDKSQNIKFNQLSKYRVKNYSKHHQVTSAISSIIRMLKIPVITVLLIFLFVIFSRSIDAYSLKPAIKMPALESPVQAATKPEIEHIKNAESNQRAAESRQKNAESKQRAALLKQEEAESNQRAAELRQKNAESNQRAAELRQKITEAQHWLQVAQNEKEQAQHWLQVAQNEKEQAQHWLQVAQNEKEQAQHWLQVAQNKREKVSRVF